MYKVEESSYLRAGGMTHVTITAPLADWRILEASRSWANLTKLMSIVEKGKIKKRDDSVWREVTAMQREQTTIRLPVELLRQLKQEAQERGIPLNQISTIILRQGLQSPHFLFRNQQCVS